EQLGKFCHTQRKEEGLLGGRVECWISERTASLQDGRGLYDGPTLWNGLLQPPFLVGRMWHTGTNLLIAVGTIIMVIGCLGCVGAVKESRPLLLTFFILLLLIFFLEILSIMLFFIYQDEIDHYAQRDLKKGLQLFGTEGNVGLTNAWMIVQTDFRCCGVTNHTDWFEVYNATRVPDSCCLEYSDNCGLDNPGTWWTAPCYERVKDWLNENLVALWIFALCTALTQILGLVFSMTMFCQAVKVETFYA
ncbi:tetraspanin-4a isoform X2, partial [Scomber scombrus]